MADFDFNNVLRARAAGFNEMEDVRARIAKNAAGRSLAQGDYTGAKAAAYGAGALDIGSDIQGMEDQQADREIAAEKDRRGQEAQQMKQRASTLAQVSTGLLEVPQGQRKAVLDRLSPVFQKIGADPSIFANLTEEELTDDALHAFGGEMKKAADQYTLGVDDTRYDAKGNVIARGVSSADKPQYQKLGAGETLLQVGGASPSGGGSAPASGSAPRNQRNNNPGNIEDGDFAKSLPGYKGSDGRFAIFETPDAGKGAQVALLQSYGKRGFNTVSKIINRWAPPTDNNPTPQYAQFVAQKLGVSPDQPLDLNDPQVAQAVAGAIEQFEGGGGSASNGGARVIALGAPKPPDTKKLLEEENLRGQIADRAAKQQGVAAKQQAGVQQAQAKAGVVIGAVESALGKVNVTTSGFVGGNLLSGVKGTPAYNLAREIDTIRANLSFDELSKMRAASPTGGALGAVSDREIALLGSTVASLDAGQSPEQLKENLQKIKQHYANWLKTIQGGSAPTTPSTPPAQPAAPKAPAPPRMGEVRKGYRFRGGDPANPQSWIKASN